MIFETVVYDGAIKDWRILNINTGTVYSKGFDSKQEAIDAVEHGTIRDGLLVQFVSLESIQDKFK